MAVEETGDRRVHKEPLNRPWGEFPYRVRYLDNHTVQAFWWGPSQNFQAALGTFAAEAEGVGLLTGDTIRIQMLQSDDTAGPVVLSQFHSSCLVLQEQSKPCRLQTYKTDRCCTALSLPATR